MTNIQDKLDHIDKMMDQIKQLVQEVRADAAALPVTPSAMPPMPASHLFGTRTAIHLHDLTLGNYSKTVAPTIRQANYIRHLCEKHNAYVKFPIVSQQQASSLISHLRNLPEYSSPAPLPNGVTEAASFGEGTPTVAQRSEPDKLPYKTVDKMIPQGRYAVQATDGKQTLFLMVRTREKDSTGRPVTPYIQISYKSGDMWNQIQNYYENGNVRGRNEVHGTVIADALSQIMMNANECAIRYAEKFGECTRCGRELTDDRSRYYSLGTECIKHRATLVAYIDSKKGKWQPGAASQ